MIALLKIIYESIVQGLQQLGGNKLRSFLTLLGIAIGIFCIIGVKTSVDSLEQNIRQSFDKLGNDVIYIQKIKWGGDPDGNWMKYLRRPNITYSDYEVVQEKATLADMAVYLVGLGSRTLKYRSNSVEGVGMTGVTYDFADMYSLQFEKGRYFSLSEYRYGASKAVLGYTVAEELFGTIEPIGKIINVRGQKIEVIGVLEKSGDDLVSVMNFDEEIIITYELGRKIANLKPTSPWGNSSIAVKAAEGVSLSDFKGEITGIVRANRRLKPLEEENFSLNELSIVAGALNSFFDVLNILGLVIGGFSILVGGFSVANIMFVSVKERTSIIGVKKALGAKRYMILLEFLVEAVVLCILGGLIGLALIWLMVMGLAQLDSFDFDLFLTRDNVMYGIIFSIIIGLVSGAIPAFSAANMDPVEAMRQ